ncbi:hypothetical protein [Rhodococcoides kyotonense]|uniref:Lysin B n=1 Tax=Rhodococcoides kyotonense TaxID=398843 RepID=A0A239FLH1_9NOCA|nr:hypothetical protein [Rhodococcus kyotonensis]SNS57715.1 hypothetical protein SAMN05421642_103357 [Rhodococcus kyotonensis]
MIDVITIRGTGNPRGVFNGMTGVVAKQLNRASFRIFECNFPATIGNVGAGNGIGAHPLDVSVELGVADLARQVRDSPNPVGLISYSLGGIVASRFLEGVALRRWTNPNGSPLEVAFHLGIANPARNAGDHVVPVQGSGIHSSHGPFPRNTVNLELCDARDIIGATPRFSPLRNISRGLSPFAALQLNETDPFRSLDAVKSTDWLSWLRESSYLAAGAGLTAYLVPYGNPGRTPHTGYAMERMPGQNITWTDWAAQELNRRFA